MKIIRLQTIDSTHKFAIRLVESNKAVECAIIAKNQTNGVGRCDRTWISLNGNLFTSIIKKRLPSEEFGKLSLAIACAVHEVIHNYIPYNLYLHWPNDIYYRKSKIAGILIVVIDCWLIISIGVNINSTPDIKGAVSFRDVLGNTDVSEEKVLIDVWENIDRWFDNLCTLGFLCVKDYWLRYINETGCKITVRNGKDSFTGIFIGIDDSGRLILEENGKNLFISSGDMFMNTEGMTVDYE